MTVSAGRGVLTSKRYASSGVSSRGGVSCPVDDFPAASSPIESFFNNGEQGVWYNPADFSTMFQDAAGTTAVTAVGQPVGKILDKSGRGNHATQATATSRPILQQDSGGRYYLAFDGVDDWLSTPSIDFTGTDKMTVWAGVRKLSDAATGVLYELSADASVNNGAFVAAAPGSSGTNKFTFGSRGTILNTAVTTSATWNAPVTTVHVGVASISGDVVKLRLNGSDIQTVTSDQGTGNYGNYPIYIGRRGGTTLPFNGRLYGLIVRGAASSDAQIVAAERYMNFKTGAY